MSEKMIFDQPTTEVLFNATKKITRKYIMNGKAEEAAEINDAALIVAGNAITELHKIVIALPKLDYQLAMDLVGKIAAATYLTGVAELIKNRQEYKESANREQTPNSLGRGIPSDRELTKKE
jgi:hypothetical protein